MSFARNIHLTQPFVLPRRRRAWFLNHNGYAVLRPADETGMIANGATIALARRRAVMLELRWTDGLGNRPITTLFVLSAIAYIGIYALEGPIRYLLYLQGRDNFILARDALMLGPLALLAAADAFRLRIHPALPVFALLAAFHGLVLIGTVHSALGAAYGLKIVINLLFGFFIAGRLLNPGRKLFAFFIVVWIVTLIGVGLDKFVMTFPWVGIKTIVGGLNVDVSKDWEVTDELARRVAGFARTSICVALLMPLISIVLMCRTKNTMLRGFLAVSALGADFLTTQKGSIAAFFPIAAVLCLRPSMRLPLLRACCIVFAVAMIALPIVMLDVHFAHGTGIFSGESLGQRLTVTWPEAWHWIGHRQFLLFGVGLGGIGGPQRLYAEADFNPADNMFVFLYAYFGVFAVFYLLALCLLVLRPVTGSKACAIPALASIAFLLGYGAVVSIIEDQLATLFLGAAVGVMIFETRPGTRATSKSRSADYVEARG